MLIRGTERFHSAILNDLVGNGYRIHGQDGNIAYNKEGRARLLLMRDEEDGTKVSIWVELRREEKDGINHAKVTLKRGNLPMEIQVMDEETRSIMRVGSTSHFFYKRGINSTKKKVKRLRRMHKRRNSVGKVKLTKDSEARAEQLIREVLEREMRQGAEKRQVISRLAFRLYDHLRLDRRSRKILDIADFALRQKS
jgi:hypothetical protein